MTLLGRSRGRRRASASGRRSDPPPRPPTGGRRGHPHRLPLVRRPVSGSWARIPARGRGQPWRESSAHPSSTQRWIRRRAGLGSAASPLPSSTRSRPSASSSTPSGTTGATRPDGSRGRDRALARGAERGGRGLLLWLLRGPAGTRFAKLCHAGWPLGPPGAPRGPASSLLNRASQVRVLPGAPSKRLAITCLACAARETVDACGSCLLHWQVVRGSRVESLR